MLDDTEPTEEAQTVAYIVGKIKKYRAKAKELKNILERLEVLDHE